MKSRKFGQLIDLHQRGVLPEKISKIVDEWEEHLGKEELPDDRTEEEKEDFKRRTLEKSYRHASRVIYMTVYRAAAAVLLVAVTSYIIWNVWFQQAAMHVETSSLEQPNKVMLADGSIVWLKGESSLSYADDFSDERHVILKGEALFEVAKDPNRPFTIHCGNVITQVLGTSFSIIQQDNNVKVQVYTGNVRVTTQESDQEVALKPYEKAIYINKTQQLIKEGVLEEEVKQAIAGTEYNMYFDDAKVRDIVHRIEGKFDVTVTMSDPQLGDCNFTGDLTDQSLTQTLELMAKALQFEYEIAGRDVTLQGGGFQCK